MYNYADDLRNAFFAERGVIWKILNDHAITIGLYVCLAACLPFFLFPRVEWHNVPFGCRSSRLGLLLHVQPLPSTGCLVMPMVNLFMCLFVYLPRVSGRRPLRLGLLLHHRQQIFGDLWFSFFRLANGKIYLNINVFEMWQTIRKLIGGEEEAGKNMA